MSIQHSCSREVKQTLRYWLAFGLSCALLRPQISRFYHVFTLLLGEHTQRRTRKHLVYYRSQPVNMIRMAFSHHVAMILWIPPHPRRPKALHCKSILVLRAGYAHVKHLARGTSFNLELVQGAQENTLKPNLPIGHIKGGASGFDGADRAGSQI